MKLLIWLLDIVRLRLHRAIMKKNKSVSNYFVLMKTVGRNGLNHCIHFIPLEELPRLPMHGVMSESHLQKEWY